MVNILLEGYEIDRPWLYGELRNYIHPNSRVAVIAFSFRDVRIPDANAWNDFYGVGGIYYEGITRSLLSFGISRENVTFLNYFSDTKEQAAEAVRQADILYFLGGLPDRMMERIREFDLYDVLMAHSGVVMGYSAGAVIQLAEYHLSEDKDYPKFGYYEGLPYLNDFYLEVHYEATEAQKSAIRRVLEERKKPVYATACMKGAVIVDNGVIKTVGDVKKFGGSGEEIR